MELVRGVAEYKRERIFQYGRFLGAGNSEIGVRLGGGIFGRPHGFFTKLFQISRGYQSRLFWGDNLSYMDELLCNMGPGGSRKPWPIRGVKGLCGEQKFSELFSAGPGEVNAPALRMCSKARRMEPITEYCLLRTARRAA